MTLRQAQAYKHTVTARRLKIDEGSVVHSTSSRRPKLSFLTADSPAGRRVFANDRIGFFRAIESSDLYYGSSPKAKKSTFETEDLEPEWPEWIALRILPETTSQGETNSMEIPLRRQPGNNDFEGVTRSLRIP